MLIYLESEKVQVITIASFISWTWSAALVVGRFACAARRTWKTLSCRQTRRMVGRRIVRRQMVGQRIVGRRIVRRRMIGQRF